VRLETLVALIASAVNKGNSARVEANITNNLLLAI
jgi:hypothetical protein